MKKLIMFLFALMLMGCNNTNDTNDEYTAPYAHGGFQSYQVGAEMCTVVIDSCEYIGTRFQLAHKGNCKFCEARRKEEIRKLIDEMFMMQD